MSFKKISQRVNFFDVPPELTVQESKILSLRLNVLGWAELAPLFESVRGTLLHNRFQIGRLITASHNSFLLTGMDLAEKELVVIKVPALNYLRPIMYSEADLASKRSSLRREFAILQACQTGHFPKPIAFFEANSPLAAMTEARSLLHGEFFLVEEFIEGRTLNSLVLGAWRTLAKEAAENKMRHVISEFLRFWGSLQEQGFFYTDISPENLMIETCAGSEKVRVVDAGSAVPQSEFVQPNEVTPAYTTPSIYASVVNRQPVLGSIASVLPILAKLLHFALTRQQGINGELPDMANPILCNYTPACRAAINSMLELDENPQHLSAALRDLDTWIAKG